MLLTATTAKFYNPYTCRRLYSINLDLDLDLDLCQTSHALNTLNTNKRFDGCVKKML